MLVGFHHAAICTPDLDRCLEFYCGALGCEVAWTFDWEAGSDDADAVTGLKNSAARAAHVETGRQFSRSLRVFVTGCRAPIGRAAGERPRDYARVPASAGYSLGIRTSAARGDAFSLPAPGPGHRLCHLRPGPRTATWWNSWSSPSRIEAVQATRTSGMLNSDFQSRAISRSISSDSLPAFLRSISSMMVIKAWSTSGPKR